jgi:hypothetical protein
LAVQQDASLRSQLAESLLVVEVHRPAWPRRTQA